MSGNQPQVRARITLDGGQWLGRSLAKPKGQTTQMMKRVRQQLITFFQGNGYSFISSGGRAYVQIKTTLISQYVMIYFTSCPVTSYDRRSTQLNQPSQSSQESWNYVKAVSQENVEILNLQLVISATHKEGCIYYVVVA